MCFRKEGATGGSGRQVQVSLLSYVRCPPHSQEENNPGGEGGGRSPSTAGLPVAMERWLGFPTALAGLQWNYCETVSHGRAVARQSSTRGFILRDLDPVNELHHKTNNDP